LVVGIPCDRLHREVSTLFQAGAYDSRQIADLLRSLLTDGVDSGARLEKRENSLFLIHRMSNVDTPGFRSYHEYHGVRG
jgi:hypothetical protein